MAVMFILTVCEIFYTNVLSIVIGFFSLSCKTQAEEVNKYGRNICIIKYFINGTNDCNFKEPSVKLLFNIPKYPRNYICIICDKKAIN